MAKIYYKVVCEQAQEMAGAGLGYEEIYDCPRFFWSRDEARRQAAELNSITANHNGAGSYVVEEGHIHDDGSWDDEGDQYAQEQLGLSV
jgi:hypothetical protein